MHGAGRTVKAGFITAVSGCHAACHAKKPSPKSRRAPNRSDHIFTLGMTTMRLSFPPLCIGEKFCGVLSDCASFALRVDSRQPNKKSKCLQEFKY
jgi:hypothetical protein